MGTVSKQVFQHASLLLHIGQCMFDPSQGQKCNEHLFESMDMPMKGMDHSKMKMVDGKMDHSKMKMGNSINAKLAISYPHVGVHTS